MWTSQTYLDCPLQNSHMVKTPQDIVLALFSSLTTSVGCTSFDTFKTRNTAF
jgi:hypothetical protein